MKLDEVEKYARKLATWGPDALQPVATAKVIDYAQTIIKLVEVARCAETIVHNFEELSKTKYHFDFTPNMVACRTALTALTESGFDTSSEPEKNPDATWMSGV